MQKKLVRFLSFLFGIIYTYIASLLAIGTIIPVVGAAVTALIYLSSASPNDVLHSGIITTLVIWGVAALAYYPFATIKGANMRSYGLLHNSFCQLENRLQSLGHKLPSSAQQQGSQQQQQPSAQQRQATPQQVTGNNTMPEERDSRTIALNEAWNTYETLKVELARPGLQWVFATGYVTMWDLIHRVYEALVEVEPVDTVVGQALTMKWSIQGSQIEANAQKEWLAKLSAAINDLSPSSKVYFDQQPDAAKNGAPSATSQTQKKTGMASLVQALIPQIKGSASDDQTSPDKRSVAGSDASKAQTGANEDEADPHKCARAAIRQVMIALNTFRDGQWEQLIRARNQLTGAMLLTGLVTYALLIIVITRKVDPALLAPAMGFYVVGAAAGLFGQLYNESHADRGADDYGLFIARLLATPVLSGLAGIGGVIITVMLFSALLMPQTGQNTTGTPTPTPTSTVTGSSTHLSAIPAGFPIVGSPTPANTPPPCKGAGINHEQCITSADIFKPDFMLDIVAGVFGLFPNLIISLFLRQARQYVSDLKTSEPQDQSNTKAASNT